VRWDYIRENERQGRRTGGIVHALLPDFVKNHANNVPDSLIDAEINAKYKRERYCDLETGIQLAKSIGYKEAKTIYTNDPKRLKKLLLRPSVL
jgi:hypothetical protein